jgi:ATP-dependent DNA helicase RecG
MILISPKDEKAWEHRLANLGFLTEPDGMCSIAGMVLFGKNPRQHLKQSGLRTFAFTTTDKVYKAEMDVVSDAPLAARWDFPQGTKQLLDEGLIERALQKIMPYISEESDEIRGALQRDKTCFYPIEAIREVLINALMARDWTRFVDIEIGIYSNRLEVISPGSLQNPMTIEKMIAGQIYTRNTIMMEVMRDYGYVDFRGMGLRTKIIPLMRSHNGCEPVFEATEDHVKVTLPRRSDSL